MPSPPPTALTPAGPPNGLHRDERDERDERDDRKRLLLLRLSAIGDIVHTLPVAAALAAARYEVIWAVQPGGRPLVAGNPAVPSCVVIPASTPFRPGAISRAVAALRAARPEIALDLQGLWKSGFWARASGATRRVGWSGAARQGSCGCRRVPGLSM